MEIIYEQLNEETLEEVVERMSYNFAYYEPMGKYLKIDYFISKKFFRAWLRGSYLYSYVAKNVNDNKIIGAILNNDLDFFRTIEIPEILCPKRQIIKNVVSTLEESFNSKYPDIVGKKSCFYNYAVYVEQEYKGRGISLQLFEIAIEKAKEHGFNYVMAVCTGQASQAIVDLLGYISSRTNRVQEIQTQ